MRHPIVENHEITCILNTWLLSGTVTICTWGSPRLGSLIFTLLNSQTIFCLQEHTTAGNSDFFSLHHLSLLHPSFGNEKCFINSGKLEKTRPSEGEKSLLFLAIPSENHFLAASEPMDIPRQSQLEGKAWGLQGSDKRHVKHEEPMAELPWKSLIHNSSPSLPQAFSLKEHWETQNLVSPNILYLGRTVQRIRMVRTQTQISEWPRPATCGAAHVTR